MTFQHRIEEDKIAIYIHWPFCKAKCPYCDFNSHVGTFEADDWLRGYLNEITYFSDLIKGKEITSIFFGGGTPSLMPTIIPEKIIDRLAGLGKLSSDIEITLEANPTSVESEKFASYKLAGVNRLSIGVQSLDNNQLRFLGREHNNSQAISAINLASKVFDNFSFDLIYALPGQTLNEWKLMLSEALNYSSQHISLYQLTIEKGTPFYKMYHNKEFELPLPQISAEMYEYTNDQLESKGYNKYEISNYAKIGFESKHNLSYWNYNSYIGLGPGAHSRLITNSAQNDKQKQVLAIMLKNAPKQWLESQRAEYKAIQTLEALSASEVIDEKIMMSLRLSRGVDDESLISLTGKNFVELVNPKFYELVLNEALLVKEDNIHRLTDKGLLLHSYIVPRLLTS